MVAGDVEMEIAVTSSICLTRRLRRRNGENDCSVPL
jgi:hypothetical protein